MSDKNIKIIKYAENELGDRRSISENVPLDETGSEYFKDRIDNFRSAIHGLPLNYFAFDPKERVLIGKVKSELLSKFIEKTQNLAKRHYEAVNYRFANSKTEKAFKKLEEIVKEITPFTQVVTKEEIPFSHPYYLSIEIDNGAEYAGVLMRLRDDRGDWTSGEMEKNYLAFFDSLPEEFWRKEDSVKHLKNRLELIKQGYRAYFHTDETRTCKELAEKINAEKLPKDLVQFYIQNLFDIRELQGLDPEAMAQYIDNDEESLSALFEAIADKEKDIGMNIGGSNTYYVSNIKTLKASPEKEKEHNDYVSGLHGRLKALESWYERFNKCRKTVNLGAFFQREEV